MSFAFYVLEKKLLSSHACAVKIANWPHSSQKKHKIVAAAAINGDAIRIIAFIIATLNLHYKLCFKNAEQAYY